jgi:hypothetical protein
MGETTSPMMIRDMPVDIRMRLKAIAAMQHRRLGTSRLRRSGRKPRGIAGSGRVT